MTENEFEWYDNMSTYNKLIMKMSGLQLTLGLLTMIVMTTVVLYLIDPSFMATDGQWTFFDTAKYFFYEFPMEIIGTMMDTFWTFVDLVKSAIDAVPI